MNVLLPPPPPPLEKPICFYIRNRRRQVARYSGFCIVKLLDGSLQPLSPQYGSSSRLSLSPPHLPPVFFQVVLTFFQYKRSSVNSKMSRLRWPRPGLEPGSFDSDSMQRANHYVTVRLQWENNSRSKSEIRNNKFSLYLGLFDFIVLTRSWFTCTRKD